MSELPAGDKEIVFDIKFMLSLAVKIIQFVDNKYTNNTIPITIKPNEITCIKFNSRADENGTMIEAKDRIIATDKCLQEIKNSSLFD